MVIKSPQLFLAVAIFHIFLVFDDRDSLRSTSQVFCRMSFDEDLFNAFSRDWTGIMGFGEEDHGDKPPNHIDFYPHIVTSLSQDGCCRHSRIRITSKDGKKQKEGEKSHLCPSPVFVFVFVFF